MATHQLNSIIVDRNLENIKKQLAQLLGELDTVCVTQGNENYNGSDIKKILGQVDTVVSTSPEIRNARINGLNDVSVILDAVNQNVLQRIAALKSKLTRDEDKKDLEVLENEYNSNQTNSTQKKLDEYEKGLKVPQNNTVAGRKKAAEGRVKAISKRIDAARKFQKVVDEGVTAESLKKSLPSVQKRIAQLGKTLDARKNLKKPDEYKAAYEEFENKSDFDEKDLLKFIRNLESLKNVPEIARLIAEIESKITFDQKKSKKILSFNKEDIEKIISQNPGIQIDWEKVVNTQQDKLNNIARYDLTGILREDLFKLYSEKAKRLSDELDKTNPDFDAIYREISEFRRVDQAKFQDSIDQQDNDRTNLAQLIKEHDAAQTIIKKLEAFETIDQIHQESCLFGKRLGFNSQDGTQLDLRKIKLTDENVDKIYNGWIEQADEGHINREYESIFSEKYRNPGFFKRFFWKLTHPETWGKRKSLADYRREEWIKQQIRNKVDKIQTHSAQNQSANWTLSPEDMEKFKRLDKERVEAARQQGRILVLDGQEVSKVQTDVLKEFRAKQDKADLDLFETR